MNVLSRVNVYHVASSPTIIFAESGFVTRVRLSVCLVLTNRSAELGRGDQWEGRTGWQLCRGPHQGGGWAGGGLCRPLPGPACGSVSASESRRSGVTQWETGRQTERRPVRSQEDQGTVLWVMTGGQWVLSDLEMLWWYYDKTGWETYQCIVVLLWSLITHTPSLEPSWYYLFIQITKLSISSILCKNTIHFTPKYRFVFEFADHVDADWPMRSTWWAWSPQCHNTRLSWHWAENMLSVSHSGFCHSKESLQPNTTADTIVL